MMLQTPELQPGLPPDTPTCLSMQIATTLRFHDIMRSGLLCPACNTHTLVSPYSIILITLLYSSRVIKMLF